MHKSIQEAMTPKVRRLPVVEEDGRLVGILAQADVAAFLRRTGIRRSGSLSR